MPKRMTYLEARPDRSLEAFRDHWSTTHADIARELPGVTAYRQNHVLPPAGEQAASGAYRVDGIVELWFADNTVVNAGFHSDVADKLAVDEQNFLTGLTGGPVLAGAPHAPWPFKLWVLARWADGALPAPRAVERWAQELAATSDGALGCGVSVLVPGAELLVRDALRREEQIPEVAIAVGFAGADAARRAATRLGESLEALQDLLARVHVCTAEEIVII